MNDLKMTRKNKKIEEIFKAANSSQRFVMYQNRQNPDLRQRSLYLSQILMYIRNEFPEFKEVIEKAMTEAKTIGASSESEETKRKAIIKSLRNYAASVPEIAEDTGLIQPEIREILVKMQSENLVRRIRNPLSEIYQDDLWFLNE